MSAGDAFVAQQQPVAFTTQLQPFFHHNKERRATGLSYTYDVPHHARIVAAQLVLVTCSRRARSRTESLRTYVSVSYRTVSLNHVMKTALR